VPRAVQLSLSPAPRAAPAISRESDFGRSRTSRLGDGPLRRRARLAEELDPEEWHGVPDRFFSILSESVLSLDFSIIRDPGIQLVDRVFDHLQRAIADVAPPVSEIWIPTSAREAVKDDSTEQTPR